MKRLLAISILAALSGCAGQQVDKDGFVKMWHDASFASRVVAMHPEYYVCFSREMNEVKAELDVMSDETLQRYTADMPQTFSENEASDVGRLIGDSMAREYIGKHANEFTLDGLSANDQAMCERFYEWKQSVFVAATK